jgi:hypothetical protein
LTIFYKYLKKGVIEAVAARRDATRVEPPLASLLPG